jgi:hypothetical protein
MSLPYIGPADTGGSCPGITVQTVEKIVKSYIRGPNITPRYSFKGRPDSVAIHPLNKGEVNTLINRGLNVPRRVADWRRNTPYYKGDSNNSSQNFTDSDFGVNGYNRNKRLIPCELYSGLIPKLAKAVKGSNSPGSQRRFRNFLNGADDLRLSEDGKTLYVLNNGRRKKYSIGDIGREILEFFTGSTAYGDESSSMASPQIDPKSSKYLKKLMIVSLRFFKL